MTSMILRVMVGVLAFLVGVTSSHFWPTKKRLFVQSRPIVSIREDQPAISPPSEKWRKIVVRDRFIFYIPPYLKDDVRRTDEDRAIGVFRTTDYFTPGISYLSYDSSYESQRDPRESTSRYRLTDKSVVLIGGKRASMFTEIPANDEIWCIHDVPRVHVYFPDIGRGQTLDLYMSGDLDDAKQILKSIEFP